MRHARTRQAPPPRTAPVLPTPALGDFELASAAAAAKGFVQSAERAAMGILRGLRLAAGETPAGLGAGEAAAPLRLGESYGLAGPGVACFRRPLREWLGVLCWQ